MEKNYAGIKFLIGLALFVVAAFLLGFSMVNVEEMFKIGCFLGAFVSAITALFLWFSNIEPESELYKDDSYM